MATPRKRFAAIETTLLREEWPNEVKLALVFLTLHMVERWAAEALTAEQGITCRLSLGDALNVASCDTLEDARATLRAVAGVVSLTVHERGDWTIVCWPKLAITQRWEEVENRRDAASHRKDSVPTARPLPNHCSLIAPSPLLSSYSEIPSLPSSPVDHALPMERIFVDETVVSPTAFELAPEPATKKPKRPRKTTEHPRRTLPPEEFSAEERAELKAWCERSFPLMLKDLPLLVAECLDWGRSKGEIRADWPASARNWVRREAKQSGRDAPAPLKVSFSYDRNDPALGGQKLFEDEDDLATVL